MQVKGLLYCTELHLYGASRLGIRRKGVRLYENGTSPYTIPDVQQNTLGNIAYEITNYLGNVNVVISDRKLWVPASSAFKAVVLSRTDYFPFGMEISSRTTNSDNYRFGYNGMESDNETKGSGNSYTTEFRQYDPRIGRWLSLDPLMAQYPMMSPYVAFNNNPIYFVDPLGLEGDPPMEGDNGKNECDDGKSQTSCDPNVTSNDPPTDVTEQTDPDGRAPKDWIKDKDGKYKWDNNVTNPSNVPKGFKYVGKNDSDIIKDLFGKAVFSNATMDNGVIGVENGQGYVAASHAVFFTYLNVGISANVKFEGNNRLFNGIDILVSGQSITNAPITFLQEVGFSVTSLKLNGKTFSENKFQPHTRIGLQNVPYKRADIKDHSAHLDAEKVYSRQKSAKEINVSLLGQISIGNVLFAHETIIGFLKSNQTYLLISIPFKK